MLKFYSNAEVAKLQPVDQFNPARLAHFFQAQSFMYAYK